MKYYKMDGKVSNVLKWNSDSCRTAKKNPKNYKLCPWQVPTPRFKFGTAVIVAEININQTGDNHNYIHT